MCEKARVTWNPQTVELQMRRQGVSGLGGRGAKALRDGAQPVVLQIRGKPLLELIDPAITKSYSCWVDDVKEARIYCCEGVHGAIQVTEPIEERVHRPKESIVIAERLREKWLE